MNLQAGRYYLVNSGSTSRLEPMSRNMRDLVILEKLNKSRERALTIQKERMLDLKEANLKRLHEHETKAEAQRAKQKEERRQLVLKLKQQGLHVHNRGLEKTQEIAYRKEIARLRKQD